MEDSAQKALEIAIQRLWPGASLSLVSGPTHHALVVQQASCGQSSKDSALFGLIENVAVALRSRASHDIAIAEQLEKQAGIETPHAFHIPSVENAREDGRLASVDKASEPYIETMSWQKRAIAAETALDAIVHTTDTASWELARSVLARVEVVNKTSTSQIEDITNMMRSFEDIIYPPEVMAAVNYACARGAGVRILFDPGVHNFGEDANGVTIELRDVSGTAVVDQLSRAGFRECHFGVFSRRFDAKPNKEPDDEPEEFCEVQASRADEVYVPPTLTREPHDYDRQAKLLVASAPNWITIADALRAAHTAGRAEAIDACMELVGRIEQDYRDAANAATHPVPRERAEHGADACNNAWHRLREIGTQPIDEG